MGRARAAALAVIVAVTGCARTHGFATCTPPGPDKTASLDSNNAQSRFANLADWCLVDTDAAGALVFNPASEPYALTTPLFSDYAEKARTVWLPPGTKATYSDTDPFDFPVGAIITKSFSFSGKVVETRVLVRAQAAWVTLPYVWDAARRDAPLQVGGSVQQISFTAPSGTALTANYLLPSQAQCAACHAQSDVLHPIGPKARLLNRDNTYPDGSVANQLDHWVARGLLDGAPSSDLAPRLAAYDDPSSGTVEERARAWLETNCAHCHSPLGLARTTGLLLRITDTNPYTIGVCKRPIAAGAASGNLRFDIVPQQPDMSIMVLRVESVTPGIMMPEVGRSVVHEEGAALLREWITSLPGTCP